MVIIFFSTEELFLLKTTHTLWIKFASKTIWEKLSKMHQFIQSLNYINFFIYNHQAVYYVIIEINLPKALIPTYIVNFHCKKTTSNVETRVYINIKLDVIIITNKMVSPLSPIFLFFCVLCTVQCTCTMNPYPMCVYIKTSFHLELLLYRPIALFLPTIILHNKPFLFFL